MCRTTSAQISLSSDSTCQGAVIIFSAMVGRWNHPRRAYWVQPCRLHSLRWKVRRSEEHKSELQSLMRISYAVFCLQKKKKETISRTATSHSANQLTHT